MFKGGFGRLGEPFGRKPFGRDANDGFAVDFHFDLLDEVGESGETGYAVFERESRPHGEDAKIDLLEVELGQGVGHEPR